MLNFNDIKIKKELSNLGKKLENEIKIKANNKFTIKEIDLDSIGGELRENAKYVFGIDRIEGNSVALLFVNNAYKVKLGIASAIISPETLKDLSIIIEEFQKIVDRYIESQKEEEIEEKVIEFLSSLLSIYSNEREEDNG